MSKKIGALLLAAAMGVMAPNVLFAQGSEPAVAEGAVAGLNNSIQALEVADNGATIFVRVTFQQPLKFEPGSFSTANPARLAFDFPATANGLGRGAQSIERGDLRSANITQVGELTRLVLNLTRLLAYETQIDGNVLTIALSVPGGDALPGATASVTGANFAAQTAVGGGQSVHDVNFRRGTGGEGKVIVQLSSPETGIDIQKQGSDLIVTFLGTALPEHLRRRSDVSDFATPVSYLTAEQTGANARITIRPNGLWEHNAYQSDTQFVLEVKRIQEDRNKLVPGREQYQGEKLSLNFQNIDVRSVLQVIADFTDFNIVTSDSVQGSLTLRLKDVPWDQALDIILQAKGLDKRKSGNVIWIAPGDELSAREKQQSAARAELEELEPLLTEGFQINYHKASEIAAFLKKGSGGVGSTLSKRGVAAFDDRSNKLFVTDVAGRLDDVRRLISDIDIAPRQVLIESRIVEARKTFARQLGVKLGYGDIGSKSLGNGAQLGFGQSSLANVQPILDANGNPTGGYTATPVTSSGDPYNAIHPFNMIKDGQSGDLTTQGLGSGALFGQMNLTLFNSRLTRFLNLELQAEETDGNIRTISSPRVLTANNVEALIEQGTEIAYREATSSGAASLSFKDAKLSLKVKPQITPDGRLQLLVEVKKDQPQSISGYSEPAIDTKSVRSEVLIDNGGTVVIGGIYTEDEQKANTRVPFLGDLPLIGALFRTTNRTSEQRELLVFITPRIVEDSLTLR
jgi:type IV pilus assembly protein PilQ